MKRLLLVLALGGVVACPKSTPPGPSTSAASSASSASSARKNAAPAAARPFATYTGTAGGGEPFKMATEREGEAVRVLLVVGASREPMVLKGRATDSGFGTAELVGRGRKPAELSGTWTGGKLSATLRDPRAGAKPMTLAGTLAPALPAGAAFKEVPLVGSLGAATRIRAKLSSDGHALTGVYRYTRSKEDLSLSGTLDAGGTFTLEEKNAKGAVTGRFAGVFLAPDTVLARWTSPDGAHTYPVWLERGESYPEIVKLDVGGRLVPQEELGSFGAACKASAVLPAFAGLADAGVQGHLDRALRAAMPWRGKLTADDCAGATTELPYDYEVSYGVSGQRGDYVGLQTWRYEYTGGAHGNRVSQCFVADLKRGLLVSLRQKLTPAARAKLQALTVAALQGQYATKKLSDKGFYEDQPRVSENTELCYDVPPTGVPELRVQFAPYEVAPYAMGAPSATISVNDARSLFAPGSLGARLF